MNSLELLKIAKENADNNAVYYDNKYYKYSDLIAFSEKLTHLQGKTIAIAFEKSWEYVALVFSACVNQFTFVPLSLNNPEYRNNQILQDSKPDFVLIPEGKNISYPNVYMKDLLKQKSVMSYKDEFISYLIYTSGSTGAPKGVKVLNTGLDNVIKQQIKAFNLNKSKIFFYVNTVFDASISDILCSFYSGSCLYINEAIKTKFNKLHSYFNQHKIDYIDCPPSILHFLDFKNLFYLKTVVIGGELPNISLVNDILKYVNVFNVYGPTEASICTSIYKCEHGFDQAYIGMPIEGINYRLFNNELWISGIGLAMGYTDEKLTSEKFIIDDGIRYYKTGDIVKQCSNNFVFIGREDSQIKNKGQLVNLEEISLVAKSIPNVKDAFAYFADDIFLFIEGNEQELNEELKRKLPSYMMPKKIFFHNKFERNSSLKINKTKILQNYDFYLAKNVDKYSFDIEKYPNNGNKILVTGANGFLGMHLIEKISQNDKIMALVRSENEAMGLAKMKLQEKKYQLNLNWNNIEILIGDCRYDNLGINPEIKQSLKRVIHCAAEVNNIKSYDQLFDSNVLATINVLKFCEGIKLEYISTLSVFVSSEYKNKKIFEEKELVVENRRLNSGYAATKWQSEYLVNKFKQAGGQVSIYRLGLLTESLSKTYILDKSFLFLLVRELKKNKTVPQIENELYIDISPVNMVASDLASMFNKNFNKIYNVSYNVKLSYKEIITFLKKDMFSKKDQWFLDNKYKLISLLISIADDNSEKRLNYNIFETTMVEYFSNDNFKLDSNCQKIEEMEIKNNYFKKWKDTL